MTASPRASSSPASDLAGRVLAIDYGRRRIGLALSDLLGLTAQPLETLARTNRRGDLRRLSSWEAEQMLAAERAISGKRRGGGVDHLAAAVILRDYLERRQARTDPASSGILGAVNAPARRKRKQGKS